MRQLERELASTVSALRDERREKKGQTEALRSKLDKSRGTVRDMETELERWVRGRAGRQLQGGCFLSEFPTLRNLDTESISLFFRGSFGCWVALFFVPAPDVAHLFVR